MANEETCLLCGRPIKPGEDATDFRFKPDEGSEVRGTICPECAPAGWRESYAASKIIYRALAACSKTPT